METARFFTSTIAGVFTSEPPKKARELKASGVLDASLEDFNDPRPLCRDIYSDEIFSERERKRARASSRKLFCDNPHAFHMSFSEMLSVVGVPPNIQFRTGDDLRDSELESAFKKWAQDSEFWDALSLMVLALTYDGEGFARVQGIGTPAMKVKAIEPKRVSSPPSCLQDPDTLDGIEYDDAEEPTAYWVERKHVNPNVAAPLVWDKIPAFEMLHFFVPFFPEQHRGFPLFDSSERSLRAVEDLRAETIECARTNSKIHGVITSDFPFDDEVDAAPDAMDTVKMPRRGLLTLGNGQKVTQMKNEALAVDFSSFLKANVTVAGAGSMLPRNIATSDSSDYNFSSARLDHLIFSRWVTYLRRRLKTVLNTVANLWLASNWDHPSVAGALSACGGVEAVGREWYFEELELDEKTKTDVAIAMVQNKLLSYKNYYASKNLDWSSELEQIAVEQSRLAELGLSPLEVPALSGAPTPSGAGVSIDAEGQEPPPDMLPRLRTGAQIASTLGVTSTRVSGWRRRGLKSYKVGGRVLYDLDAVKSFLEQGEVNES